MSKRARLRKANRRRFESWWKSRNYHGVADMMKDFYDMKGKEYRQCEDGIIFKTSDKIWRLQNHSRRINGVAVWGVGKFKFGGRVYVRYLTGESVEYLYQRAKQEIFRLWNDNNKKKQL